jgi:2',3'-cyclic-nucleotide 2'-phosphodiesterase/3'-nucleotidase/5'-nucleotidase
MVQAGDLVGASPPVSALLQDEPTIRFMNELGFDVGTIGNHEFDEGVAEMKRLINGGSNPKTEKYEAKYGKFTGSTMDYVVANVVDENTNEPILPPYVVKQVDGVKIGFIGVVTTETPSIVVPSGTKGVKFTDEVAAINKYAKELENQGVKTIVVLAHDPGTSNTDGSNASGKVVDMAKNIDPEVDVIYGAHDHKYLNTKVNGKLLVQSWSYGTAFSDINLTLDPFTQDIMDEKAEIVDTLHSKITPDAHIKAELDSYQQDIKPIVSAVVGQTKAPITNAANDSGESALGNLIADGMRAVTGTQLAFMNSGGIRNPLPQGTITWGDLFKVQPFGNDLVTMTITGDQIRTLLNQQFQAPPSYNKIMAVSGLRYTWNDNKPYGNKVCDIYLENGKPIDPKADYTITVNNFMADGGDGFTVLKSGKNRVTNMTDLDGFIKYFKSLPQPVTAKIEGRIINDITVEQPKVDITNFDDSIYGTAEPGAKVVAKAGDKVLGDATADEKDGYFEIELDQPFAKGTVITLDITDKAGNNKSFDMTVKAQTGWISFEDEDGNVIWKYVDPKTEKFVTNNWVKDEGDWYHFDKDGIMQTGWVQVNGKWYFLDEEGAMQTGWHKDAGKWYYLDKVNGDMKVNWAQINGKWYFFAKSGAMQTGWVKISNKWYFLDQTNGDMKTGWIKSGKYWYYLGKSGAMQTGWVVVNNKWYYLNTDGRMAANTVVGGKYKVGKDGAWVK